MTGPEVDYAQSARLRAALRQWRNRQRLVTFAACSAGVAAVLSGVAIPLLVMTPAGPAIRLILALMSIGLAGAIALAIARTPAPRRIAAIADSRLQLDDSLTTAFQYADDPDDVSRLIVRDAVARIRGVSPAAVFPLRVSRRVGWAAVVTLVASTLVLRITNGQFSSDVVRLDPRTAAAASASGAASNPSVRPHGATATGSGRQALPIQPGPRDQQKSNDTAPTQSDDRARKDEGHAGSSSSPPQASTSVEKSGRTVNAVPALTASPAPGGSVSSRPSLPGASTKTGSASGAATRAGAAAQAAAGTASTGVSNTGSGGSLRPGIVNRPASRPEGGNRHGAPVARAEAALAGGRIPPGLRAYLKTYFSAIAPR